jgi:L-2-aminoadipate reductase
MPLYHFVTADLPTDTKAPELDDTNAAAVLRADAAWSGVDASDGRGVTENLMGVYLSYLVAIGFILPPSSSDATVTPLPAALICEKQRQALSNVGGRGGST